MKPKLILIAVLFGLTLTLSVRAEEGGAGHYMPGSTASFIDALPGHPSFAVENVFVFYGANVSASVPLPVGGQTTLGLDATAYGDSLVAFYQTPLELFGGLYAAGAVIPFVWMEAEAQVGGFQRRDTASGLGDIALIPFMLGWTNGPDLKYDVRFNIYAPSGEYDVGALANVGKNYWTFEPMISVSYLSSKIGLELTAFAGVDFNTENEDTDYQTGTQFHLDATVAQHLPLLGGVIGIGANGFYYQQITGDSGSGATLGDFEGRTVGVGPVLSYVRQIGKTTLATEVKWLPELDTEHRLKGDYIWFKLAFLF
jgi:hypothetical protein